MPEATTSMINLTGIDFSVVFKEVQNLVPTVLPAIISFLAFRKGWAFLKGSIKGA